MIKFRFSSIGHCLSVAEHRIFAFLFFALACYFTASAQLVTVELSLDSTAILIGEQIKMRTRVSCPRDSKVRFPEYRNGYVTEGVEMLEAGTIDTVEINDGQRWELFRDYIITAFDSAVYTIPRFEIDVNGRKYQSRNEIGLKVNTVEVDMQHPDDLRPLKAPVDGIFEWSPVLVLWSLLTWLCLLLIFAFTAVLVRAKPVTKRVIITPPTPPQKVAMAAIERLREKDKDGEHQKEYYMALTDVLRNYIVERFGFNAREMTTFEIVSHLRQSGDAAALDELQSILTTADLVKFAKFEASLVESDRALLQAVDYVRTTQIDDPEAEKAVERIVEVSDATQRRYRIALKCGIVLSFVVGMGAFCYVCYQLWLNFW